MQKKSMLLLCLPFIAAIWAQPAYASGLSTGTMFSVTNEMGVELFNVTGVHSDNPACSTTGRWAFFANTPDGQSMLATLLTAYAQAKTVVVVGTGDCSAWGDAETVSYIVT